MLSAKEIELEAFKLARKFRLEYLKFDKKIYTLKNVTKSKWWKVFIKTIEIFANREEWNLDLFVEAQFYTFGKIFPFQLLNKEAWESFLSYKLYKEHTLDGETSLIKNVLYGFEEVKNYCKKNKHDFSVDYFLQDEKNKEKMRNGIIPIHFFLFSKSFDKIKQLDERINLKKVFTHSNKKLNEKVKIILKSDYE